MVIDVSEEQFLKTSFLIEVTPSGILIEVREKQLEKTSAPIVVKDGGNDIEIIFKHPLNVPTLPSTPFGIEVILEGKTILFLI